VRGKFRLREEEVTHPVAVGDEVEVLLAADGTGLIIDVHPRRSKLSRRAAGRRQGLEHVIAANLDFVWIMQSLRRPRYNTGFIDRVLVMAEYGSIEAGIIMNKIDLQRNGRVGDSIAEIDSTYSAIGYPVLSLSAKTGEGVAEFAASLPGRMSAMVGPSGVGKSTLLNAVQPGLGLKTSDISSSTKKGRHTTAYASLYDLEAGGQVIDTPGVREYGLVDIKRVELTTCFPDFEPYAASCAFADCLHDHEPDCAVQIAVSDGEIEESRFQSYLNILDSIDT
jgi:ribosome biogenesis GTPase